MASVRLSSSSHHPPRQAWPSDRSSGQSWQNVGMGERTSSRASRDSTYDSPRNRLTMSSSTSGTSLIASWSTRPQRLPPTSSPSPVSSPMTGKLPSQLPSSASMPVFPSPSPSKSSSSQLPSLYSSLASDTSTDSHEVYTPNTSVIIQGDIDLPRPPGPKWDVTHVTLQRRSVSSPSPPHIRSIPVNYDETPSGSSGSTRASTSTSTSAHSSGHARKALAPHRQRQILESLGYMVPSPSPSPARARPLVTNRSAYDIGASSLRPLSFLLSVQPSPDFLDFTEGSASSSSATASQYSPKTKLLPLQPTHAYMLESIAREFGLPSTKGITLHVLATGSIARDLGPSSSHPTSTTLKEEHLGSEITPQAWPIFFRPYTQRRPSQSSFRSLSTLPTPHKWNTSDSAPFTPPHLTKRANLSSFTDPADPASLLLTESDLPDIFTPASLVSRLPADHPVIGAIMFHVDRSNAPWLEVWSFRSTLNERENHSSPTPLNAQRSVSGPAYSSVKVTGGLRPLRLVQDGTGRTIRTPLTRPLERMELNGRRRIASFKSAASPEKRSVGPRMGDVNGLASPFEGSGLLAANDTKEKKTSMILAEEDLDRLTENLRRLYVECKIEPKPEWLFSEAKSVPPASDIDDLLIGLFPTDAQHQGFSSFPSLQHDKSPGSVPKSPLHAKYGQLISSSPRGRRKPPPSTLDLSGIETLARPGTETQPHSAASVKTTFSTSSAGTGSTTAASLSMSVRSFTNRILSHSKATPPSKVPALPPTPESMPPKSIRSSLRAEAPAFTPSFPTTGQTVEVSQGESSMTEDKALATSSNNPVEVLKGGSPHDSAGYDSPESGVIHQIDMNTLVDEPAKSARYSSQKRRSPGKQVDKVVEDDGGSEKMVVMHKGKLRSIVRPRQLAFEE